MARLIFYDATHTYEVDGEEVPSVSEIFRPLENFQNVNPEVLRRKAAIGTLVHEYAELLDYGQELEEVADSALASGNAEIFGYVKAYANFLRDYKPDWLHIEKALYSPEHGFAGTLDRFGMLDSTETLVDLKTAASVSPRLKIVWAAKLHAYDLLIGGRAVKKYNLLLMPDGKYRLYDADETAKKYGVDPAALFAPLLSLNKLIGGYK